MSKKAIFEKGAPPAIPTGWSDTVLICRKCSKKLKGGFGADGDDTFKQAVRRALRDAGKRGAVGLLDAGCFGICPKRAVTISVASRPYELLVVPEGGALNEFVATLHAPAQSEPEAAD